MKDFQLLKLDFEDEEYEEINSNLIENKKVMGKFLSDARKKSKPERCAYCGKETKGFCNSHSIPAFCLKNIATNGEVLHSNEFVDFPLMDTKKGVNKAGTFQIICRECDSKIFQEYENPSNYNDEVTPKMVAQIAMKDYLKAISKRINENALYDILGEMNPGAIDFANHMQEIEELDLNEYKKGFEKAKRLSKKNCPEEYHVFYYKKLNYVVPIAFQSTISLTIGLDGETINDIYYDNPKYKIEDFHICVFPLESASVIMLFVDSKYKRYRNFYKKFRKLSHEDKLSIINYIIFLYSEDIYLSKDIPSEILQNKELIKASKQTGIGMATHPGAEVIKEIKGVYDLSKHDSIPNLLSEEYKLR